MHLYNSRKCSYSLNDHNDNDDNDDNDDVMIMIMIMLIKTLFQNKKCIYLNWTNNWQVFYCIVEPPHIVTDIYIYIYIHTHIVSKENRESMHDGQN